MIRTSLIFAAATCLLNAQPPAQPGTKWTEGQLRQAVAPARVGRKLTPKSWPGNARVAVCLSFDVDNESYLLAPGENSPTSLSPPEVGAVTAIPSILAPPPRSPHPPPSFITALPSSIHPHTG